MSRLMVVKRADVIGAQGPQGLPGVGSAAWQPATLYTVGSVVQAPDGSWLYCITEHTSEATFDEAELQHWTPVETLEDTLAESALREKFAAKTAQNEIEAGRLNDAVLSGRFQRHYHTFGPGDMRPSGAGLSDAPLGGVMPVWRLDKDVDESLLTGSWKPPRSWAACNVVVKGANPGTNTGSVFIRVLAVASGDGDDVTATTSGNFKSIEAAGQNIKQSITVMFNLEIDASKSYAFRILRDADDVGLDTLADDWGVLELELQATKWVEFQPEIIEGDPETLAGRTFTAEHNALLDGLRVWHQFPPPVDDTDDEEYKAYPMTDSATLQDFTTSINTTVDKHAFEWAHRYNYGEAWNKRPNYLWGPSFKVDGIEVRAVYTTLELANSATKTRIAHLCGIQGAELEAMWLGDPGDILHEADVKADLEATFTEDFAWAGVTYKVCADKVILPTGTLPNAAGGPYATGGTGRGIVLDYEVGDSRTPAVTTAFIQDLAALVQGEGYELFLYTNPLTNLVQKYHGIDGTNLPTLLDAVDYLGVMLTSHLALEGSVPAAWNAAIAKIGTITTAEWQKIVPVFELGVNPGTTLADAEWLYDKLHEAGDNHPHGVMFWRYHAPIGGSSTRPTNQKICMVCLGTVTPPEV